MFRGEFNTHLSLFFDPIGEYHKVHVASFICLFLAFVDPLATESWFQPKVDLSLNGTFIDALQCGRI